jgi:hypothetical protein
MGAQRQAAAQMDAMFGIADLDEQVDAHRLDPGTRGLVPQIDR